MPSLRLCSHIKTNGVKCGSPALRHHTLCYFHYQWQRRDQRRVRLGGPVGLNKNSGIELPLLDGPESILVSIMEIQNALLDRRIEIKMGTALLYSLQLALQANIPYSGLCAREPVRECPELDTELEMERAKSLRPDKEKCSLCPKQETCLSPRNCKKLPKLPTSSHREACRIVQDVEAPALCHAEERRDEASLSTAQTSSSGGGPSVHPIIGSSVAVPCHPERSTVSSDTTPPCHAERSEASLSTTQPSTSTPVRSSDPPITPSSDPAQPCHPERSAGVSRGAEGPCVSSPEVEAPKPAPLSDTSAAQRK